MATFSPNYFEAGKGSAVKLPELDSMEKSQQRAGDLAIKGAEMQLNKTLQDKDRFMKMLAIDPVAAISDKNMTQQAADLENYNNTWAGKYVQNKGQLSAADEIQMASDKRMLQMKQEKMLSDQKQWEYANNVITRDTRGYYDKQNFQNASQEYFKTGVLPANMLDVAPQSMTAWLRTQSKSLPTTTVPRPAINANGKPTGQMIDDHVIDKKDAQNLIFEGLSDEAKQKQMLSDYSAWEKTASQKEINDLFKGYDRNNDGVVDPQERQYAHAHMNLQSNPYVQWAMNNPAYLENAMGTKEGASKNPFQPRAQVNLSSDWTTIMDGTKKVSYPVPTAAPAALGDKLSSQQYYQLPTTSARPVSLKSSSSTIQVLTKGMVGTIKHPPTISAIPTGYDKEHDTFTFNVNKDFSNIGISGIQSGNNMQISVPRSEINNTDFLNSFVVLGDDGKKTKIGDLAKTAPATSTNSWDKYKRK